MEPGLAGSCCHQIVSVKGALQEGAAFMSMAVRWGDRAESVSERDALPGGVHRQRDFSARRASALGLLCVDSLARSSWHSEVYLHCTVPHL